MVLGLSLISWKTKAQKCTCLSKFPQIGQNAREPIVLVLLSLCEVFSNWKGGRRERRAGSTDMAEALLPSCGSSFKTTYVVTLSL